MPKPQQQMAGPSQPQFQSSQAGQPSAPEPNAATARSSPLRMIITIGAVALILVLAAGVILLANPKTKQSAEAAPAAVADLPLNGTLDRMHHYVAQFVGSAGYDTNSSGQTGHKGDFAAQISTPANNTTGSGGSVYCNDPNFLAALNATMAKDVLSVSMWVRRDYAMHAHGTSDIWLWSLSASQHRGLNLHGPYTDDGTFHFDTSGYTSTNTRISAVFSADYNPSYTGSNFWLNWYHVVCVKNAGVKQLWVDGVLFLSQTNPSTSVRLYHDIQAAWMGSAGASSLAMIADTRYSIQGDIDDYAFYSTQLSPAQIRSLYTGTPPNQISGASTNLIAWWDFNDFHHISLTMNGGKHFVDMPAHDKMPLKTEASRASLPHD